MSDIPPSNLVNRLRKFANDPPGDPRGPTEALTDEAADEIERLRQAMDSLRAALQEITISNGEQSRQIATQALRGERP